MTNNEGSLTGELEAAIEGTPADAAPTDYYNTLVGEGKKYTGDDANEKLATAYYNADRRIVELKDDLAAKTANETLLQEVLTELRGPSGADTDDEPPADNAPATPPKGTDDIAKIVQTALADERSATKAQENTKSTLKKLAETYGSERDALSAVKKAVNEDAKIEQVLNDLGKANPDAAVKFVTGMVPVSEVPGSNTPGVDNAPVEAAIPAGNGFTWDYCRKLRKSDPKLYNSSEFRRKMEQAEDSYLARGEDFFAT